MKKVGKRLSAAQAAPAQETEFSLIPRATLETLYGNLLKDRMLATRLRGTARRSGNATQDDGWAAVKTAVAAVLMDLGSDDVVAAADAMPGLRLLRGEKAAAILRSKPPALPVAAHQLIHAVGAALASKTKKNGRVAVVFWRDAEREDWRDAMEMARAHSLPLILVCPETKAQKEKRDLQPGTELPRIVVDGHDAVAVYRVAHEAIDRARRNRGATLIECASFRVKGKRGKHTDAVANMERYLRGKGMLKRGMRLEIEGRFASELARGKRRARQGVS